MRHCSVQAEMTFIATGSSSTTNHNITSWYKLASSSKMLAVLQIIARSVRDNAKTESSTVILACTVLLDQITLASSSEIDCNLIHDDCNTFDRAVLASQFVRSAHLCRRTRRDGHHGGDRASTKRSQIPFDQSTGCDGRRRPGRICSETPPWTVVAGIKA
jgi:hypothetical protein